MLVLTSFSFKNVFKELSLTIGMYVYLCEHVCMGAQGGQETSDTLEFLGAVSCLMCAMGITLGSTESKQCTLLKLLSPFLSARNPDCITHNQSRCPSQTRPEICFRGDYRFSQGDKIALHKPTTQSFPDKHLKHQLEKGRSKFSLLKVPSKFLTKTLVPLHLFSWGFKQI